jgi:hypothetical protein
VPPPFDVARRGFDRGQVLAHVRALAERIRDLESRLARSEHARAEAKAGRSEDPLAGASDHVRGLLEAFDEEVDRQRRRAELEATVVTAEARTAAAQMRLEAQNVHEEAVAEARRIVSVAREEAAAMRTEAATMREAALADLRAIRDRMRRSLEELEVGVDQGEPHQVIVLDEPPAGDASPVREAGSAAGK